MNRKKAVIFILFAVMIGSLLLAISKGIQEEDKVTVGNCDNVFVVSDGRQIYLFEHGEGSIDFNLLSKYKNYSNDGAFYDCRRNIIVSPYSAKGARRDKGGVTIFDLNDGSSKDHEIYEGINSQIGRYKSGALLLTKLIKHKKIDPDSGYVFPAQIITRDYVLENQKDFPEEVVEDYKAGKLWKFFTYTHLFDLDKREVTASYEKFMEYGHVVGDSLFARASEGLLKINLKSGYAEKLLERKSSFTEQGAFESVPAYSRTLFTDTSQYLITGLDSWDAEYGRDSRKLLNYEKNAIYEIENGTLKKVVTSPYDDMRYVAAPDDNLYIFAPMSKKVARFNTKTRELKEYDLALPIPKGWYLDSVGYTRDNFIITVSWHGYRAGGMFVVSRDFSKISGLYKLPMAPIDVATNLNIQTGHLRAINTHLCIIDRGTGKSKPVK